MNGKFADEDPLVGTSGTLIPAQWGNDITLEILHVIEAAGLVPDEDNNAQLQAAISSIISTAVPAATEVAAGKALLASQVDAETGTDNAKSMTPLRVFQAIAKKVVQATEAVFSWAKIATQALTDAGVDDATIVTPKKLRWGLSYSLGLNGYVAFPSWLGGWILQWGSVLDGTADATGVPFPMAFPTVVYKVIPVVRGSIVGTSLISAYWDSANTTKRACWVGRRFVNNGGAVGLATQGYDYIAIGK